MCGIVGACTRENVTQILLQGLRRLSYRGADSAGIAVQTANNTIARVRKKGAVEELNGSASAQRLQGFTGIAHTRWATHGEPSVRNAQPHLSNGEICLVHNGIIENYEALKRELQELGYGFSSDTDSETIVHLIHHFYQASEGLFAAVMQAVQRLEGAYAISVMAASEPGKIIVARKGCPVVVGLGNGANYLASDVLTLRALTDRFLILEEGELAEITPDDVTLRQLDGTRLERQPEYITDSIDELDKGHYEHFMAKEIHEQPQVVKNTLEGRVTAQSVLEQSFGVNAPEVLRSIESISIVGCGTAYYAGYIAKYWLEELANIRCNAEIASEFRYRNPVVPPNSLFITLSQSGETADTLASLRMAKERGFAHTMTICNVATSTLVRESEMPFLMRAGVEVSVASTKAFVAMLIDLLLLAVVIARHRGLAKSTETEIVQALQDLDKTIANVLELDDDMKQLAQNFVHCQHALFLGRGTQYPVALEGALKLKEISYLHAEGYPAGELKHGPLALVDNDMPVVAVAPSNELLEKVQSNIEEVRARGAHLYVLTDCDSGIQAKDQVTVIEVPKVHSLLAPIINVIPLQLLAYHVAMARGCEVDQPRNLAKSVTVE